MKESDTVIVATKAANNGERSPAEQLERRTVPKGKPESPHTYQAQNWERVSQGMDWLRQCVKRNPQERLMTLLHHVNVDSLRAAFYALKRDAAAGADGVTWQEYADGLENRLVDLCERVHRGAYRATPSRRVYIPKPDGGERPLGIAALEDKVVVRQANWRDIADASSVTYKANQPYVSASRASSPARGAVKRRQRGVWPGLLSTERSNIWVAETLMTVEGNMNTLVKGERVPDPRCRRTHGRTYISRRDLGGLPAAQRHGRGRQREGRSRTEDAQQGEVRWGHSSDEAGEQSVEAHAAELVERRAPPEGKPAIPAHTGHRAGFVCHKGWTGYGYGLACQPVNVMRANATRGRSRMP